MPVVVTRKLTRTHGEGEAQVRALDGVDLAIDAGTFVAVVGPSGSGKSTLLNLVGGLDTPTSGTVEVGGTDLSALDDDARTVLRRTRIGFVFQFFNLIPTLTARENVALPLSLDGVSAGVAEDRAASAMEIVGIAHRADHLPAELSGGEQQRVALARALAVDPVLILADEPTGNLDQARGDAVVGLLRKLCVERGLTIVMVTHDLRYASMADRILHLRDGRLDGDQIMEPTPGAGGNPSAGEARA